MWVTLLALLDTELCAAIDVQTEYGPVRGHLVPVALESGNFNVHSFLGIPFARSPVGSLRFAVSHNPKDIFVKRNSINLENLLFW